MFVPRLFRAEPGNDRQAEQALLGRRMAVCGDAEREVALYERSLLPPGVSLSGPALFLQMDSTVYLAPGWSARVDGYRNLVLERETSFGGLTACG